MKNNNRFVFIVPFRNVEKFIQACANSIISQNYKNWIAYFCDDCSTDNSVRNIPNNIKFNIRSNKNRISALPNIHYGIVESNLEDYDIICLVDGDDGLLRPDVLDILNSLYQDETLLTYGQYVWPNGAPGHCVPYTQESFKTLRNGGYWASHLKTFKYKLYKELINQDPDLLCYKDKNGEFYTVSSDVAIMTPLMEIAGFSRIKFNINPVYYYRVHEQNDHFVEPIFQKSVADEIFSKSKFIEKINW